MLIKLWEDVILQISKKKGKLINRKKARKRQATQQSMQVANKQMKDSLHRQCSERQVKTMKSCFTLLN
jgi:hypothetical protein